MNEHKIPYTSPDVCRDTFLLMLPLLAMDVYLYGMRPALLCLVAIITAGICDWLVSLLRRRPFERGELSSEAFALLVAMLMRLLLLPEEPRPMAEKEVSGCTCRASSSSMRQIWGDTL